MPRKGQHLSKEAKDRISKANTGRKWTGEERRARMVMLKERYLSGNWTPPFKGKHLPKKVKIKMSAALKGHPNYNIGYFSERPLLRKLRNSYLNQRQKLKKAGVVLKKLNCDRKSLRDWAYSVSPKGIKTHKKARTKYQIERSEKNKVAMKKWRAEHLPKHIDCFEKTYPNVDFCQICGFKQLNGFRLDIHHIDGDNHNNGAENLIKLCMNCHLYLIERCGLTLEEVKAARAKLSV